MKLIEWGEPSDLYGFVGLREGSSLIGRLNLEEQTTVDKDIRPWFDPLLQD